MKLSEIKGDAAMECLARVIAPVTALATDKDVMALFSPSGQKAETAEDAKAQAMERLKAALPALMVKHKADFVDLMAALNGQTAEEYREGLTFPKLLHDVYELMTDEELLAFFA